MLTEELKETVVKMTEAERKELSLFLKKVSLQNNSEYKQAIRQSMEDYKSAPEQFVDVNSLV